MASTRQFLCKALKDAYENRQIVVNVSSMYIVYLHLPWMNSEIQTHIMCFMKLSATKFSLCPEAYFVNLVFNLS